MRARTPAGQCDTRQWEEILWCREMWQPMLGRFTVPDRDGHAGGKTQLQRSRSTICIWWTARSTIEVQWSEDVIKANPFLERSRLRFRVPPWVSNTIARDHLA